MTNRADYQRRYRQKHKAHVKRVTLSFDMSEIRGFESSARRSGKPLATYVKSCAMQGHIGQREAPDEVKAELADLSRLVRTVANNVNQMARHSNTISQVLDEQEVFAQIRDLESILKMAIMRLASQGGQAPPQEDDT